MHSADLESRAYITLHKREAPFFRMLALPIDVSKRDGWRRAYSPATRCCPFPHGSAALP